MAKIRVYELARQLNMKNKALLDKMRELNISVSSHMTSLEDETVEQIKAGVLGKKKIEAIEESRVRPTVVRKRRKRPEAAPVTTENAREEDGEEQTSADDVEADEDAVVDVVTDMETDDETPAVSPTPEEAPPVRERAKPARKSGRGPAFESARVIVKAEPPKSAESAVPEEDAIPVERADTPPMVEDEEMEITEETPSVQPPPMVEEEMEITRIDPSGVSTVVSEAIPSAAGSDGDGNADDRGDDKKSGRRKRKKRKEKDMPARIITLPPKVEETVVEEPPPAVAEILEVEMPPPPPQGDAPASPASPDDRKDRKKRRRRDEDDSKKKVPGKRREVVEGADLYARAGKLRKGKKPKPKPQKTLITTPKAIKRRVKIDDTIVLSDLAKRMGIKASEMIGKLMTLGVMVTVNQTIDFDTAVLVASEFGYEVERAAFEEHSIINIDTAGSDDPDKMVFRSPVVTIMGHVDHGKTSLLDVIRKTRITEGEAGGITQHIGAYNVKTPGGDITFLDTPGHEAFTSMRARGATVTDIVVLVVAADDGVMPQTVEAINHSKAAGVPIIVAVNKMDKPGADPERVQRELSDHGLMPEDWGGETIYVRVSAKQNMNIDSLLEMILLQAEVLDLRANPDKHAKGHVIESKLDAGRGPVATILVQEGTLRNGQPIICGVHHGKIRAMLDDLGRPVDSAGPSIPVEILGLSGVPNAGDELNVLDDDKSAKQVSEHRLQKQRAQELAKTSRMSLEKLFERMKQGEVKDLNVILKADVHGSLEALSDSLAKLSNEEVTIRIIHAATGAVSESDVSLAAVSDAIIIGFNIRPSAKVEAMASEENVDMRFYDIIYNVIKDVKDAIVGMMESKFEDRVLGRAEVRQVFQVPKVGAVAGCYVINGEIHRGKLVRLIRDGVIIHQGGMGSLRRFKDDVKEVKTGYECGIGIENYNDIKVGDVIECYYLEEIKPELA